jgi:threonine synthase
MKFVCRICGNEVEASKANYICECGGMYDIVKSERSFKPSKILDKEWSLFRYENSIPVNHSIWKDLSMGEGMTAIKPLSKAQPNLFVKLEYAMPTLSFKDRGAVVLISKALQWGAKKLVQDSSGNAGVAVAAYASRGGLQCDIYVPKGTSEKKIAQIESHGAKVIIVNGSREDTQKAAIEASVDCDVFYASHVFNPVFYEGTKTYIYEIYEQLGELPERLVVPLGNGSLFLGIYQALLEFKESGLIVSYPEVIVVQAEGCAPIYEAFVSEENEVFEVKNAGTEASGIAIANPRRGNQILSAIREIGGKVILAPNNGIMEMKSHLAHLGYYVEPTTAATFAGYFDYVKSTGDDKKAIIPLCGSGLKK